MFVRLKDELDNYHKRRKDAHGTLYIVKDPSKYVRIAYTHDDRQLRRTELYEATSIATGVLCTLSPLYVEEYTDGLQEP